MSVAEFDVFLAAQPDDDTIWELVDGQILAMTNPNANHGQIALNMGVSLKAHAEAVGCRVNVGGMRVQASDALHGTNKTIPDVVVWCGARGGVHTWIDDPVIIVEILSPSTMDFDRGGKLLFYKSLPSLRDIVIVYQDERRVEHYRREDDDWLLTVLTDAATQLAFSGLACAMTLDTLYTGTALSNR